MCLGVGEWKGREGNGGEILRGKEAFPSNKSTFIHLDFKAPVDDFLSSTTL